MSFTEIIAEAVFQKLAAEKLGGWGYERGRVTPGNMFVPSAKAPEDRRGNTRATVNAYNDVNGRRAFGTVNADTGQQISHARTNARGRTGKVAPGSNQTPVARHAAEQSVRPTRGHLAMSAVRASTPGSSPPPAAPAARAPDPRAKWRK